MQLCGERSGYDMRLGSRRRRVPRANTFAKRHALRAARLGDPTGVYGTGDRSPRSINVAKFERSGNAMCQRVERAAWCNSAPLACFLKALGRPINVDAREIRFSFIKSHACSIGVFDTSAVVRTLHVGAVPGNLICRQCVHAHACTCSAVQVRELEHTVFICKSPG